jgi:hypothetical protein
VLTGCGHELVRDHAAAHQTVVAVPEVVCGDRRTRSDKIVDRVSEDPDRAAVQVSLQVAADVVVVVAQTVRFPFITAGQQKPSRLDRTGGDDNVGRAHCEAPA